MIDKHTQPLKITGITTLPNYHLLITNYQKKSSIVKP
jgi:hypothetical protein